MALLKYIFDKLTPTDVISRELDMTSRRTKVFPKCPDCSPGTVLDDNGVIVGSTSTSANVVLEYKSASPSTAVSLLVANTNLHIKEFSLKCNDVNKAMALLAQDNGVYFSNGYDLPTT